MSESDARPTMAVQPEELPASVREAGLTAWIREPLDDAVDRKRRVIMPPAAATTGTPLSSAAGPLMALSKRPDTVMMMGDDPAPPQMPERPALRDFTSCGSGRFRSTTCCRAHGWRGSAVSTRR